MHDAARRARLDPGTCIVIAGDVVLTFSVTTNTLCIPSIDNDGRLGLVYGQQLLLYDEHRRSRCGTPAMWSRSRSDPSVVSNLHRVIQPIE